MHFSLSRFVASTTLGFLTGLTLLAAVTLVGCGGSDSTDADVSAADSNVDAMPTTDDGTPKPADDSTPKPADDGVPMPMPPEPPEPMPPEPPPAAKAPSVADLTAQLADADTAKRIEAMDELGKLGDAAKPAVPVLVKALGEEDSVVRWRAARALGGIGPAASEAVGPLVAALGNSDPSTRAYAAFALGQIGDKSPATVTAMLNLAVDTDPLVRRAVLLALRQLKPPREVTIPLMAKLLEGADPAMVTPALHSMAEMGADVVPALVEALDNEKAAYWATLILEEIATNGTAGDEAPAAIAGLIKASGSTDSEVRTEAMLALAAFGPDAKSAEPQAIEILSGDEFTGPRYAAAYALGRFGVAEGAVEPLEKAAGSDDELLKLIALQALARLKPEDTETVTRAATAMAQALGSEDANLRAAAARGLAEFQGSSEITAPALEKAIDDAKPEVILNALNAFVALGAKAVPRVKRGLTNEKLRHYAVQILGRIGPDAKDAIPELVEALKKDNGSDPQFRAEVQFALGSIGSTDADAVPALIQSLSSEDEQVQHSACYALRQIGPAAKDAVEPLEKNLDSKDHYLALLSVWALLSIEPDNQAIVERAVPLLAEGLSHENEMVRIECCRSLGELGPAAKGALEQLEAVDGSEQLKAAAADAIKKIKG